MLKVNLDATPPFSSFWIPLYNTGITSRPGKYNPKFLITGLKIVRLPIKVHAWCASKMDCNVTAVICT